MDQQSNLLQWSISELSEVIKRKQISPVEITKKTLEAIVIKDNSLNSYITVLEDEALAQAKKAEKMIMEGESNSPLCGIPIGLKDLIYTKNVRTTAGSAIYKDFYPEFDGEVVTRLKNSGAVIIGKLNMHEFAYGITGDRSYYGSVTNPYDSLKIAGGSSSGSGAAVAAGLAFGSIGSDTGGSIRIPASCCGIVGMKPTFGRVSRHGTMTLSWTLDHLGPMTRTVKDNAIILSEIAGYDERDSYSVNYQKEDFTSEIGKEIEGFKIGIPTSYYLEIIQPEVKAIYNKMIEKLKVLGATIEYIDLPYMNELQRAQSFILTSEAYGVLESELQDRPEKILEEVRGRITSGKGMKVSDYIRALEVKHKGNNMFQKALKNVDVIMTPTLPILPTDIDQREIEVDGNKMSTAVINRLTGPTNTIGFPSISVPGGFSTDGLPVGIQFIGKPFSEKYLYQVAYQVENKI